MAVGGKPMRAPAGVVVVGHTGPGEQPGNDLIAFGREVVGPVAPSLAVQHGRHSLGGNRPEGKPGGDNVPHRVSPSLSGGVVGRVGCNPGVSASVSTALATRKAT